MASMSATETTAGTAALKHKRTEDAQQKRREWSLRRRIRPLLGLFIAGLVVSGLTAIPLETELRVIANVLDVDNALATGTASGLQAWIARVRDGVVATNRDHPFIAYGTDWLAFGHLMIAVVFIGPFRNPWRNQWVITFGLIACSAVIPMALVAGTSRGIPWGWRLIDCTFGVLGALPLLAVKHWLRCAEADRQCN